MPIRPEMRDRYPKDWPLIRARILRRAEDKCEWCRVPNHALGGRLEDGTFVHAVRLDCWGRMPLPGTIAYCEGEDGHWLRIIRVVLTIAHVHNHDPADCRDENLAALCQRCHLRHDRRLHAETRRAGKAAGDLFHG